MKPQLPLPLFLLFGYTTQTMAQTKPMNIVYIMSDDHSYQTIGVYDNRFAQTPHLDWIANHGVRFTNSFVANSLSGPSRACMLTGKHSHRNGFTDNSRTFDGSQFTYPKLLQQAGYQTAMIGKWHLDSDPTGFDYWDILIGQGDYYNPDFRRNGRRVRREGYVTNVITDVALDWLSNRRDPDRPFCLLLHHKAPHRVWSPDTCDLDGYRDVVFPLPPTFYDDYIGRRGAREQNMNIMADMDLVYDLKMADRDSTIHSHPVLERWGRSNVARMNDAQRQRWDAHYDPIIRDFKQLQPSGHDLAEWKYQRYMQDYLQVITSLDRNVGRVIQYLEDQHLLENTMLVYTSDQGFFMGEHGYFDKRYMYEESFRTPLLIYFPGGKRGDIAQMVQNIDYAPTFLEVAGIPVPEEVQGNSFLPLLRGEKVRSWRKSLYYHYHEYPNEHRVRKHYGVRTDRYTLMHFYDDFDEWELYDLRKDPHQMHNLYGERGTASLTKKLKQELLRLQEQYDDPIRFRYPE